MFHKMPKGFETLVKECHDCGQSGEYCFLVYLINTTVS